MSNLTNNTSELRDILAAVQNLPEAGSGAEPVLQEKTVTENGEVTPDEGYDGLSKVFVDVPTGGGDVENQLHAILDGTLTEIDSPVTTVRANVCNGITTLKTVSLPNAKSIGTSAFQNCTALASVDIPEATSIGASAFQTCSALKSIDFPKATSIGNGAFRSCSAVTSINLPNATSIGSSAFQGNSRFGSIDLPKVKTIASSAFQECRGIKRLNIPMCTSIAMAAFYICSNLEAVIISNGAQVCTLGSTNVFSSTKISAGTGYIYVPRTLDDGSDGPATYAAATNWSTYAAQIRAIEDYPEITGG